VKKTVWENCSTSLRLSSTWTTVNYIQGQRESQRRAGLERRGRWGQHMWGVLYSEASVKSVSACLPTRLVLVCHRLRQEGIGMHGVRLRVLRMVKRRCVDAVLSPTLHLRACLLLCLESASA
jgi:hypothetical protein